MQLRTRNCECHAVFQEQLIVQAENCVHQRLSPVH